MKKYLILFAIATSLFVSSCGKDFLDKEKTGVLTADKKAELLATDPAKVLDAAMAGITLNLQQYVYSNMSHNYFGQKGFDYRTSLMGNDMIMTGRFGMSLYHYLLDYRGEQYAATANCWYQYYDVIAQTNEVLRGIAGVDLSTVSDEVKAKLTYYKAQALGYRGYAYWYLTTLYSLPYKCGAPGTEWGVGGTHGDDLCVPIVTENTPSDPQPRATLSKVYEQIISDLTESYNSSKSIGKEKTADVSDFDGCVAATYLARAYMMLQNWDEAIKYSQVVMDNYGVLTTAAQLMQGFSTLSLPDVVFGCPITDDNSTIYMSFFSQMDMWSKGYAGIGVWRAGFGPFVDRISATDIRKNWFLYKPGVDCHVKYQSEKFIGEGRNAENGEGNWHLGQYIYLRSEEAYFNKAEALAHKGELNDAKAVLESVMKYRDASYSTAALTDKATFIEELNFQKRVEFWGEGMEWIDNKRLNIPVDRTLATWPTNNNHYSGARIKVGQEDILMLYQLPLKEIDNNPAIGPQNQND